MHSSSGSEFTTRITSTLLWKLISFVTQGVFFQNSNSRRFVTFQFRKMFSQYIKTSKITDVLFYVLSSFFILPSDTWRFKIMWSLFLHGHLYSMFYISFGFLLKTSFWSGWIFFPLNLLRTLKCYARKFYILKMVDMLPKVFGLFPGFIAFQSTSL